MLILTVPIIIDISMLPQEKDFTYAGTSVTIAGECFSAFVVVSYSFSWKGNPNYQYFRLDDKKANDTKTMDVLVAVDQKEKSENPRWVSSCINKIRRAFDSGRLDFDVRELDEESRVLTAEEFNESPVSTEAQVRRYIQHLAYWRGFRLEHVQAVGAVIEPTADASYLGIDSSYLKQSMKSLEVLGWIKLVSFSEWSVLPTSKLIEALEAGTLDAVLATEKEKHPERISKQGGHELSPGRVATSIPADLFISYSSKDLEFVQKLAKDLSSSGVHVWWDKLMMKVGDSLHKKIQEGITNSAWLGVVLSPNSVSSPWVELELNSALMKELGLCSRICG